MRANRTQSPYPPAEPYPRYPSIVPAVLRTIVLRLLQGRQAEFPRTSRGDMLRLVARVSPQILYQGTDAIPTDGGCLVTVNHYSRPGFSAAWNALAVSSAFPCDVSWVMTDEWVFQGNPLAFIFRPVMRFILASIRNTYGFLAMPTMAEGYSVTAQRSAAVRHVIEFARLHPRSFIGLSPEGQDSDTSAMGPFPSGVGKFILYLNRLGFRLFPAGICEQRGQLVVRFGAAYDLEIPVDLPSTGLDEWVSREVRQRIQELLPGGSGITI